MKRIRYASTLYYYDGPQVFEARDAIGGHYVAVMIAPENDRDRYLVSGVAPDQLLKFRSGTLDLRSLLLLAPEETWYIAKVDVRMSEELILEPQTAPLATSGILPSPGFML